MKYIFLRDQLGDGFGGFLSSLDGDEETVIVLDSNGGDMGYADILVHLLNSNPERFTLIANSIYSAAFYIFYRATCKRKIVRGAKGMFHFPYSRMEMAVNHKPYYVQDEIVLRNFKEWDLQYYTDWCQSFMKPDELEKLHKNDDVFFVFARMRELFPEVEVI